MITDFLINWLLWLFLAPFYLIGSLPPMPQIVIDNGNFIIGMITPVVGLLQMIYSPILFTAVVGLTVALMLFEVIYWTLLWTVKKIPLFNIH